MHTRFYFANVGFLLLISIGSASGQSTYRLTDVGDLGVSNRCSGGAINTKGQVTGTCSLTGNQIEHPFRWNGLRIRDLGSLGGRFAFGELINNLGWVAGHAWTTENNVHGFLWDGSIHDLGTLGGTFSSVSAINDAGQVTGRANTSDDVTFRAVIWEGSTVRDLGTLGGTFSNGSDINNAGWVTGTASIETGDRSHAFLWDGTEMRDLGTLGGLFSVGVAMNEAGHVTGNASIASGERHAFFWDGSEMHGLGTLGGGFSSGVDVNESGWVTGRSFIPPQEDDEFFHAFLWDGSSMHDIGTLPGTRPSSSNSRANAINASGQVTGWSESGAVFNERAFLYDNNTLYDLNDLIDTTDPNRHYILVEGHDINDLGQIVATGITTDGSGSRVFIVSPTDYRILGFFLPTQRPLWTLGDAVTVKVALADVVSGKLIPDSEATALLAKRCRVRFSVRGAQSVGPACMTYDPSTNKFSFDWQLARTGAGQATIAVDVSYRGTSTTMVRKSKRIAITE